MTKRPVPILLIIVSSCCAIIATNASSRLQPLRHHPRRRRLRMEQQHLRDNNSHGYFESTSEEDSFALEDVIENIDMMMSMVSLPLIPDGDNGSIVTNESNDDTVDKAEEEEVGDGGTVATAMNDAAFVSEGGNDAPIISPTPSASPIAAKEEVLIPDNSNAIIVSSDNVVGGDVVDTANTNAQDPIFNSSDVMIDDDRNSNKPAEMGNISTKVGDNGSSSDSSSSSVDGSSNSDTSITMIGSINTINTSEDSNDDIIVNPITSDTDPLIVSTLSNNGSYYGRTSSVSATSTLFLALVGTSLFVSSCFNV